MDREPAVPILLAFLGFVLFAREGLVGIGRQETARLRPGAGSAMADRHATALPLPDMLRREIAPDAGGEVLNARNAGKRFRALKAVNDTTWRSHPACAGRAEQGRQSPQPAGWHAPPDSGHAVLDGSGATGRTADKIAQMGTGSSFRITSLFPT